ncbi:MAG: glycosyltransferase, partial [Acidimicrobiia bacterium]|nr:glycosyltransferase [Acidimicrobiia bacterium]
MRIGFGTSEFDPLIPGGAGTLVAQLVRRLRQRGDDVRVVIGTDDHPAASDDFVTVVDPVVAPGWDLPFMDRSMAVAEGLSRLHSDDPFDLVEIQDFDGLAFWTLSHRRDLGFGSTPLLVRFHGPVDLQIEAMGTTSHELDTVAAMERESFRMADGVIVPSVGVGELVADRYGIDSDRIVLGAPAVRSLTHRSSWRGGGAELLVIGRLSQVKGSHDTVRASVPVLESHPDLVVTFAGAYGWSLSRHEPMRTFLDSMIPAEVADRIRFLGHVAAPDLAKKVESCVAVVVPSRFESFNLAVHEARIVGAPVIVPDIPAFEGLLDATTGAEVYDGTVEGLTAALEHVVSDPGFARDLATRPIPGIGEPTDVYVSDVVDVRHVRSQGGLGTAALARVEAVWFDDARVEPRSSLSKTVLSRTPAGLVRVLKPLVPRRLRTRLRTDADWDRIVADRVFEERWTDAVRRLTAEPPPAHPRTVFVIPCFNQGRWVRDAVLSVTDQTDSDWGVVIVDDGSTDPDTREVLDSIAMPGVEVIRQDNTGLPAARNAGIRATTSEYVVPLDADDTIDPTFLERLRVALEHDPDAGYAHCWARLYGDLDAVWATRPPNPYQLMISNAVVGCVVLRRDIWANAGGYDESMQSGNEDW